METARRTRKLGDGMRIVERYVGADPTTAGPGADAPRNWKAELTLVDGEIIGGWIRTLGADINLAPHPSGEGVILEIGGVRHGIPLDMWEEALADFQKIHTETSALRDEKRAEKAAREAQKAAEAAEPLAAEEVVEGG